MFNSRLFKRANECECENGSCTCGNVKVMGRSEVKAALASANKLATYLEEVGGSFRDVRNVHEASRKMANFLRTNTNLVPASVESAAQTVLSFQAKLASNDFDYDSLTDESGPNEMFDAPDDLLSSEPSKDADVVKELGNDGVPVAPTVVETKVAASDLLDGEGTAVPVPTSGKWDNFSNEALTDMIKTLSDTEGFDTDSESQKAVAEMATVLSTRPTPVEMEEEAKEPAKSASNRFKGLNLASMEKKADVYEHQTTPKNLDAPAEAPVGTPDPAGIPAPLPTEEEDPSGSKLGSEPKTASEGEFGVRWSEFGKDDRIVKKQKDFKTEAARTKYTDTLEKKDNFKCFDAWSDPTPKVKEGKIASENDELKVAESAEKKIEKLLKFIEDFDISAVLEAKGTTPAVQRLQSALDTLKETASMTLKDVEIQINAIETTEEERKDSMEKKGSHIRGLRLAGIE